MIKADRLNYDIDITYTPTEKQRLAHEDSHLETGYGGAVGGGKLLRIDEPIPTPAGWTSMGALREGDAVIGGDGKPVLVEKVFGFETPFCTWKFIFDDGSEIESGEEHLWLTFNKSELSALRRRGDSFRAKRRLIRPSRGKGKKPWLALRNTLNPLAILPPPLGTVRSTKEIVETLKTKKGHTNHAMPLAKALDLPDILLPLDPYILGLWLGDGTSANGSFTTADLFVVKAFSRFNPNKLSDKYGYGTKGLRTILRNIGVLGNKHIPQIYLRAGKNQRLELLRGLMDTDGTVCSSGSVEFTNTNKRLAYETHELILSLGWKARCVEGKAALYGRYISQKWDIKWTPSEYVFHLPRKKDKQKLATRSVTKFRYLVSAKPVPPTEMRCIRVANKDGLYLVGRSFLVTHNTVCLVMEGLALCLEYPGNRIFMGRKIARHFRETTLQTFLRMVPAGIYKINEQKQEIKIKAGNHTSVIQYGGLLNREELDRFTSAEYGAVLIDQAEELEEQDFITILSRLRFKLPSGLAPHYRGFFTANPRACSFKQRFITSPNPDVQNFIPSTYLDNPHLDSSYIPRLRELYKNRPGLISAFLEGNWDILESSNIVIKTEWVEKARTAPEGGRYMDKCGVSIDPARFGDDETVIYGWAGTKQTEQDIYGQRDLTFASTRALALCRKIKGNFIAVDGDGLGAGVVDILRSLEIEPGIEIMEYRGSQRASDPLRFYNRRAEAYWTAGELFSDGVVSIFNDSAIFSQLTGITYTYSGGRILLDDKKDFKKKLGQSPDRADACVIGLWALKRARSAMGTDLGNEKTSSQKWVEARADERDGIGMSYASMEE
ncbi:MAG TPA: phage terminase large subunit [Thermodesulfovibrionia bacterium]|nr:phage terminase large subunit [Thermodesulfovibrionia bacterium]